MNGSSLIAVGSDYEVFVRKVDGEQPVSAIPLIEGNTDNRIKLRTCSIHHDNVLAEVNVKPQANTTGFVKGIVSSLEELNNYLMTTGHTYVIRDSMIMPERELRHVDACEFGCSHDYNVYSLAKNPAPSAWEAGPHRTAGGHIHVSYTFESREDYLRKARLLSTILSLGTTVMGDSIERRKLYGKADSVRFKPYGVEVRTPSNIWLKHEEWIIWVFNAIYHVLSCSNKGNLEDRLAQYTCRTLIDECCTKKCGSILSSLKRKFRIDCPVSEHSIRQFRFGKSSGHCGFSVAAWPPGAAPPTPSDEEYIWSF